MPVGRLATAAVAVGATLAMCWGSALPARAGEGPFAWIYTLDLQPQGTWQAQQWLWLQEAQAQGDYHDFTSRTEFEYGLTPWYQVGVYLNARYVEAERNAVDGTTAGPGVDPPIGFNPFDRYEHGRFEGVSVENVIRLFNPYTDGFGLGVYIEPELGPRESEIEIKLLGQKNYLDDRIVLATNLVAASEHEQGRNGETENASVLDLLIGASYRFAPGWSGALEFRNHREFIGNTFGKPEHSAYFLGPTLHYGAENWWATFGWRHQLPIVEAFSSDQKLEVKDHRIYGDEHTRDEFMFRFGIPIR